MAIWWAVMFGWTSTSVMLFAHQGFAFWARECFRFKHFVDRTEIAFGKSLNATFVETQSRFSVEIFVDRFSSFSTFFFSICVFLLKWSPRHKKKSRKFRKVWSVVSFVQSSRSRSCLSSENKFKAKSTPKSRGGMMKDGGGRGRGAGANSRGRGGGGRGRGGGNAGAQGGGAGGAQGKRGKE